MFLLAMASAALYALCCVCYTLKNRVITAPDPDPLKELEDVHYIELSAWDCQFQAATGKTVSWELLTPEERLKKQIEDQRNQRTYRELLGSGLSIYNLQNQQAYEQHLQQTQSMYGQMAHQVMQQQLGNSNPWLKS